MRTDSIDRLQLLFAISEQGVAFARTGVKLEVRVRPYPDEIFPGEVYFVSPSLDPATRRMILKAWVPNTEHRLRPGLFANVDLEIAHKVVAGRKLRAAELVKSDDAGGGPRAAAPGGSGT